MKFIIYIYVGLSSHFNTAANQTDSTFLSTQTEHLYLKNTARTVNLNVVSFARKCYKVHKTVAERGLLGAKQLQCV